MHWTLDDYHRAIEAGVFGDRRVELIDGGLYEMPPMGAPHSLAVRYLARVFAALLLQDRLLIQMPIVLSRDGEPEPDLAVVRPGSPAKPGPADVLLAIEVTHTTRTIDRGPKLEAYLEAGLREVWIVDLVDRELLVYRDSQLVAVFVAGQGKTISPADVAEITVDVDTLFAAAEAAQHGA
jgi:Uma2 family endonuclease